MFGADLITVISPCVVRLHLDGVASDERYRQAFEIDVMPSLKQLKQEGERCISWQSYLVS